MSGAVKGLYSSIRDFRLRFVVSISQTVILLATALPPHSRQGELDILFQYLAGHDSLLLHHVHHSQDRPQRDGQSPDQRRDGEYEGVGVEDGVRGV